MTKSIHDEFGCHGECIVETPGTVIINICVGYQSTITKVAITWAGCCPSRVNIYACPVVVVSVVDESYLCG